MKRDLEASAAKIGERLVALRQERGMRVSQLARAVGVSPSLISQIERGQSRPSVETLFNLSQALSVPVDMFFGDCNGARVATGVGDAHREPPDAAAERLASVVAPGGESPNGRASSHPALGSRVPLLLRKGQRPAIDIHGGVRWERLTPTAFNGLEFLELIYAPGAQSHPQLYRHPGMELVLVTAGRMTITVGFDTYELDPGDSIVFPSSTPHRYVNAGAQEARAITAIIGDEVFGMTALAVPSEATPSPGWTTDEPAGDADSSEPAAQSELAPEPAA